MPKTLYNILPNIDKELKKYCIDNNIKDKRDAISRILKEKFNLNNKTSEGIKSFIGMK